MIQSPRLTEKLNHIVIRVATAFFNNLLDAVEQSIVQHPNTAPDDLDVS